MVRDFHPFPAKRKFLINLKKRCKIRHRTHDQKATWRLGRLTNQYAEKIIDLKK
jgi:hypothetical protein